MNLFSNLSGTPHAYCLYFLNYYIFMPIFFDFNSYAINKIAKLEIERLYRIMMQYPELHIEVIGHSDSKGNTDYNFELSVKRANSVIEYLVSKVVEPTRFLSRGVGELENIAINQNTDGSDNPEGRKRREGLKYMRENGYTDAFIVDCELLSKSISK